MPVRSYRVTIQDWDGVSNAVEVTAANALRVRGPRVRSDPRQQGLLSASLRDLASLGCQSRTFESSKRLNSWTFRSSRKRQADRYAT